MITINVKEDEEQILKYQTHKHTFTCTKKNKNNYFIIKEDEGFGRLDGKMKGTKLKTPKCRFHFPRFPMRVTTFLEPLLEKDASEMVIKKADMNLTRIKKYMLRSLFQDRSAECTDSRKKFFNLNFDQFLEELGLTESDYMLALQRGVTGRGYMFLKRDCNQVFINNFNRNIMSQLHANNDFQLCIDEHQVAAYVINYLCKNEAGQSKMLREVDDQCAKEGLGYSEKLKRFADALDQSREVSVQVQLYIMKL